MMWKISFLSRVNESKASAFYLPPSILFTFSIQHHHRGLWETVASAILTWLAIRLPSFFLSIFFSFLLPSLGYVRTERASESAAKHMTSALLSFFSISLSLSQLACALLKSLTVSCSETIAKLKKLNN